MIESMWYWISSSIYWLVKLFNGDWHNMTSNIIYCQIIWWTTHITNPSIIYESYRTINLRNCIHKVQLYWICMMMLKSHNSYKNHWIKMAWYNMINYQIWKLSDQQPQRNCIHKVKQDRQTKKLYAPILSLYAGTTKIKLDSKDSVPKNCL